MASPPKLDPRIFEKLKKTKAEHVKDFFTIQPPDIQGEGIFDLWDKVFDKGVQEAVVACPEGPTADNNRVYPYEKIRAIVGDDGNWKWKRMWSRWDEVERRGPAYYPDELLNLKRPNKNPNIKPQKVLIVGAGPIGLRLAIELKMGGHEVQVYEKRREDKDGQKLGFTNRINRPHNWPFLKQDLAKLNGKDLLAQKQAYPVFTEPHTSSIGIDECQCLLLKIALILGCDIRLGASYVNATVIPAETGKPPRWDIENTYDKIAAERYGKTEGTNHEQFDCLVGCDGGRSLVRETCAEYFGGVEKRKFMDSVGIVCNLQKLSNKRMQELGFGKELNDMSRTKMVFKDFFKKIETEANVELDTVIYYRAAMHNYCIFTPTRRNLRERGICGQLYHFAEGRDKAKNAEVLQEKAKLKEYALGIIKAAGIPYDATLPNDGFLPAPNDCMAFDFSECWNTKKGIAFELPHPDEPVDDDMKEIFHPLVALAGDALFEPFWPMGLGLKRGWQALMDVTYAIDNLYNTTLFTGPVPGKPTPGMAPNFEGALDFNEHQPKLQAQMASMFDMCKNVTMTEPAAAGEYSKEHVITKQLKKVDKDAELIPYYIEIDPWSRYAPLHKQMEDAMKYQKKTPGGEELHPLVEFHKAKIELKWPDSSTGKALVMYNGKVAPNADAHAASGLAVHASAKAGSHSHASHGTTHHKPTAAAKSSPAAKPTPTSSKAPPRQAGGIGDLAHKAAGVGKPAATPAKSPQTLLTKAPVSSPTASSAPRSSTGDVSSTQAALDTTRDMIRMLRQQLAEYEKKESDLLKQLG